jgi:hypothetical protein
MSVDDLRCQKALALLDLREAEDAKKALQNKAIQVANDLKNLAGHLAQSEEDNIFGLPDEYRTLSADALQLMQQFAELRSQIDTAKAKLSSSACNA